MDHLWKGKGTLRGSGTTVLLLLSLFFWGCSGENVPDCLQSAGEPVREEVSLPPFTKITVFEKVALVLREGPEQKVEVETGEFLRNEVSAQVEGDRLVLRNENGCNLFREYGLTTVYVTSPNITELRSSTGLSISSDGVLSYPSLTLLSESFTVPEAATTDGEFNLRVNSERLDITVNGIASFALSGAVEDLNITIAAGDSRINARELLAQNVRLNHRGSNDVLVDPQQRLAGVIRGTGDVLSYNRPATVTVDVLFNGRLIFVE
ncbi:head GIN domain-containing protein [Maribacter sp. 2307ULW6-5]|uniref:head GIN domain-containing protein n=1 Tax=Maribacter sp. 2307ULW6-5 TaxID=3386275 RepID=UPI0039BD80E7